MGRQSGEERVAYLPCHSATHPDVWMSPQGVRGATASASGMAENATKYADVTATE